MLHAQRRLGSSKAHGYIGNIVISEVLLPMSGTESPKFLTPLKCQISWAICERSKCRVTFAC
jgi:hypothetical protein